MCMYCAYTILCNLLSLKINSCIIQYPTVRCYAHFINRTIVNIIFIHVIWQYGLGSIYSVFSTDSLNYLLLWPK